MPLISSFIYYFLLLSGSAASPPQKGHGSLALQRREVNQTNKAGLAWPNGRWVDMKQFETTGKVGWYYTWSPWPVETSDLEFVPMLWGPDQVNDFTTTLNRTRADYEVTSILAINEPQERGQSNMTPEQGAEFWKTYIEPLKSLGLRLGAPATSSAPSGKQWVLDWLAACSGGCTVDFVSLHWYDINATQFISYVEDFHETFKAPIWVTEWACQNFNDRNDQCTEDEVVDFLNTTQSWMDRTPWVERYAYYGAMKNININEENALMDNNGKINALGQQYIGANINNGLSSTASAATIRYLHLPHLTSDAILLSEWVALALAMTSWAL